MTEGREEIVEYAVEFQRGKTESKHTRTALTRPNLGKLAYLVV